jgi:putative ABC transport system substrate-binding protein
MRRREFITLLGGAAASWPLLARAQPTLPVIGFLGETPDLFASRLRSFRQGLGEMGFVEAQNVRIEYRWAEGHYDRLQALANDLIRRQVVMIAAGGSAAALAAKAVSANVPIVFAVATDPVALGLVDRLARPGHNVTGVTTLGSEIAPKQLELLHELLPAATTFALIVNPTNPAMAETVTKNLIAGARTLGVHLRVLQASTERDLDAVFADLAQNRASALAIGNDLFFNTRLEHLVALTVRHSLPAIHEYREFAMVGGLMSYGTNVSDLYRQVGVYAGRILKGERPANLPVQQAVNVELVINLKTAKTLGLTFPISLLGRADEVIE